MIGTQGKIAWDAASFGSQTKSTKTDFQRLHHGLLLENFVELEMSNSTIVQRMADNLW